MKRSTLIETLLSDNDKHMYAIDSLHLVNIENKTTTRT